MSLKLESDSLAFTFKGGMLPMTVMELAHADPERIRDQLAGKLSQSPAFFQHTPVVLGVEKLAETHPDLERICAVCRAHKLLPVAVRGGSDAVKQAAWALGLGWFPPQALSRERVSDGRPPTAPPAASGAAAEGEAALVAGSGRIYRGTVRSGQQVAAPEGDLVVLGAVNAGAEVLAAGSIHVYGVLRGRALAGIHGDPLAAIFCRELRAELLSVAGNYKRLEDVEPSLLGAPVQVRLDGEQLVIATLA